MDGLAQFIPLSILAEYLIKSSLVLLAALALAALCRRRSAALRHFILALFLGALLFLPFFARVPGGWTTRLLPAKNPGSLTQTRSLTAGGPQARQTISIDESFVMTGAAGSALQPGPEPQGSSPSQSPSRAQSMSLPAGWLALAWVVGAFLVLLRLGLGLSAARRLTKESRPMVDPVWRVLMARFMSAVSLKRRIRLRSHSRVHIPFTWGLIRPVVLMPVETEPWSEDERSTALFHELSHIKRMDFLAMLLVRLSLAVYWLNPLTWVVFGALRREQEKACDELVLRVGIKPSTYAENLLRFRRRTGRGWSPAVALLGLFGKPQLRERLAAILKYRMNFVEVKMRTKLTLVCIVVLALGLIGTARPSDSTKDKPAKPPKAPVAVTAPATPAAASAPAAGVAAPAAATVPEAAETPVAETAPDDTVVVKKITVEPTSGEKGLIEVTITSGDASVKKVIVDKPVILIRTDPDKKTVLVTSDENKIKLDDGTEVRLEVRKGDWTLHKAKKVIKLDKGEVYHISIDETPEPEALTVTAAVAPEVATPPAMAATLAPPGRTEKVITWVVEPGHKLNEGDEPHVSIEETPEPEAVTGIAETAPEAPAPPAAVAPPAAPGKMDMGITYVPPAARISESHPVAFSFVDGELSKKLEAIREQLKQVKENKLGLDEVDKSLAALEESLKKHDFFIKNVGIAAGEFPTKTKIVVVPPFEAVTPTVGAVRPVPAPPVPSDKNFCIVKVNDKDKFEVTYVGKSREISKDRFVKVVNRIKKELPSGFSLEPMFEEESGKVTFTIKSAPPGTGEVNAIVEKLTKIIKDALKEEGPKK